MKKLVYVGFAFVHHKETHAGYHHIKEWLNYDYVIDCQDFFERCEKRRDELTIIQRIIRRITLMIMDAPVIPWYAARIIWLGLTREDLVFHFIYGENTFLPWLRYFVKRSNKFVCTFHQPMEFFDMYSNQKRKVKYAHRVILVSNAEIHKFENLKGKHNVVYIPHGIASDFYSVDRSVKKENIVLTVGNWLRDYEFANKVYDYLLRCDQTLSIHVVTNKINRKYITDNPRIKFFSDISDDELRHEYLKCSVLFLPLKRYTANNSLLEAGATGCNIVIASNHSDNTYLPKEYITITKMKVSESAEAILRMRKSEYNIGLSEYIRSQYEWKTIAEKTLTELLNT